MSIAYAISPTEYIAMQAGHCAVVKQDGIIATLVRERIPEWDGIDVSQLQGRLVGHEHVYSGFCDWLLDGVLLVRLWPPEIDWPDGREMRVTQKYAVL